MDTAEKPLDEVLDQAVNDAAGSVGPRASWPFSLDTIQKTMAPYEARAKQALIGAFLWCNDNAHPMHMVEFAEKVGSNKNTLYKIYTGRYRYADGHAKAGQIIHPKEKLIKAIEDFLSLAKKRFLAGNTALVITPTLESIV